VSTPAGDCSNTPTAARPAVGTTLTAPGTGLQRLVESAGYLASTLASDIKAIRERDPAATNTLEILTCYPGLHALWFHRAAHALWKRDMPVLPRLLSQLGRFVTGIEIHPGAKLGEGFFIDHGAGVVIGETAEVGDNVTVYQGVTLGGTGKQTGKRHPTVGDNVVIGAASQLLGDITVGDNVRIGAGSVVVQNVPSETTVVGNPGRPVISEGLRVGIPDIDYTHLPDPVAEAMKCLVRRMVQIENELEEFRKPHTASGGPDARPHGGLDALESSGPVATHRPDRSLPASDSACDPARLDGTPDF
jgi:serine O-acetyltransferase